VPGSHWKPSSHVDMDAMQVKEQEESDIGSGKLDYESGFATDEHVESVQLKI
jgi:hypothetical protein